MKAAISNKFNVVERIGFVISMVQNIVEKGKKLQITSIFLLLP